MRRFLSVISCILAVMLQGCVFVDIPLNIPPSDYQEVEVDAGKKGKILILDVDGVITSGPTVDSPLFPGPTSTVNSVAEKLEKARHDDDIKAVILRVDSPGGGVTASDLIYDQLEEYKQETGVPIYVSMLDLAASGGYYISMAGKEIYAHPTTVTGSIGVIAVFPNIEKLSHMVGIEATTIKTGPFKDIGAFWNEMAPEEQAILQSVVDEMFDRFLTVIESGRPKLSRQQINELADGRVYTAKQALSSGLIDGVMYLSDVIDHVRKTESIPDAKVVLYRKTLEERVDSFYATSSANASPSTPQTQNINLINLDIERMAAPSGPVFHYLWIP